MSEEENVKNAYDQYRIRMGLPAIDWTSNPAHKPSLCLDAFVDCFQARRAEPGDYELDEVSAYRGSIMAGIGMTKHGRYNRKLGDELGIPRKRCFDTTQHALSPGFEQLAVPSNKEIMLIEYQEKMHQLKADNIKAQVRAMGMTFSPETLQRGDEPAGSRMPKPFKKT